MIANTSATATLTNVTVDFSGFTGTNATYFKAPADLTRTFLSLAPGATQPAFFYIDYAEVCNHSKGGGNGITSNPAQATAVQAQVPGVTVAKSASPTIYSAAGTAITYTVSNTGIPRFPASRSAAITSAARSGSPLRAVPKPWRLARRAPAPPPTRSPGATLAPVP